VTTGKWMVGIGLGIGLLLIIFVNATKNESTRFDDGSGCASTHHGCRRLSTANCRASHAETAACSGGIQPPEAQPRNP
jgi:hypothetical protein